MSIYAGLKTHIGANVTGYSGKVFPSVAPEGTALPYSTYQQLSADRDQTLGGYTGYMSVVYTIAFYANTYIAARTAADEWIEHIKNYTGALGAENIQCVEMVGDYEDMDYVGSIARYRAVVDCRFYYVE